MRSLTPKVILKFDLILDYRRKFASCNLSLLFIKVHPSLKQKPINFLNPKNAADNMIAAKKYSTKLDLTRQSIILVSKFILVQRLYKIMYHMSPDD